MHDPMADQFPELDSADLAELGGWPILKEARQYCSGGAVLERVWEKPIIRGRLKVGGTDYFPRLNLRSLTFAENRCNCRNGKTGMICAHAIALCVAALEEREEARLAARREKENQAEREMAAEARKVHSLVLSEDKGALLAFEILLPPNLPAVAARDSIMIKVETVLEGKKGAPENLDRGRAYRLSGPHYAAAATIETWCEGRLHGLLQLSRDRLLTLLAPYRDVPAIFWVNKRAQPLKWIDGRLAGVYEHLSIPGAEPTAMAGAEDPQSVLKTGLATEGSAGGKPLPEPPRDAPRARRYPSILDLPDRANRDPAPAASARPGNRQPGPSVAERNAGAGLHIDGSSQFLSISLPPRGDPAYSETQRLVKSSGFNFEPRNGRWWLRDRHRTLNFLATYWEAMRGDLQARFSESFLERTAAVKFADVSAETTDREGVFTLEIALRAGPASEDEIRQALDGSNRYIDTQEGVFLLAPDLMERLLNVQKALSGQYKRPLMPRIKRRLRSRELADAEALLEEVAQPIIPTGAWGQRSGALRSVGRLTPAPVRASLDDRLRGYQRIGVAWMWHLYRHDLCGILADEMGLGKTVQALALIACACDRAEGNEPSLIICPAGLIENWRREAAAFAPWLKVFTHHRERRLRDPALFPQYDLIITSYATLVRDLDLFKSAPLSVVVADEAQHIKNRRSQSAKALRSLAAPQRFVLTGTPVENSLDDLRSLFEFLMPGLLEHIPSRCGRDERAWYDQRHRKKAAPYILRRNKQLVAPELPEKIEQVIFCRMEEVQRKLYEDLKTATQRQINDMEMAGNSENKIRFAVLTRLLRLRQACVDPRLVDPACVAARGAKLDALAEIVDEAMDGGHRILLFSQFVSALTIIREEFEGKGVPYAYLDGKTQDRSGVCDHFNSEPSIPVFLISLKAGGTGLNLTGADTVVHFDPWWNPAVEAQATDRAHRIGQTRIVTSIKLIVADSVEEKVLAMQRRKADILRDLLDESAVATAKVSLEDIKDLLS